VVAKDLGFILEHFNTRGIKSMQPNVLDHWEKNWMERFPINTAACNFVHIGSAWQLQLSASNFPHWIKDQAHHSLCFDGASKGNLGATGAGGVLYDRRGQIESTYHLSVGNTTNNQAEQKT
jgi:hypothetical protein